MLLIYPCSCAIFGCCVLPLLKFRFTMREVRKARVAPDVPTIRVEIQVPAVGGLAGFHFAFENGGFWCGGTGFLVFRVEARSPAAAAGVKVGDVLEEINGQRVREMPYEQRTFELFHSIFQAAAEKPTALQFVGMVFMRPANPFEYGEVGYSSVRLPDVQQVA
jgi:membrane-associated protease RseP (regulator of RpoE activity)